MKRTTSRDTAASTGAGDAACGVPAEARRPLRELTGRAATPGTIAKTVQTGVGPVLVPKRAGRVAGGLDDMVVSLYAHGMSNRDIIHHPRQVCGTELSPATVSAITDAVLEEVKAWQSRPLDPAWFLSVVANPGERRFACRGTRRTRCRKRSSAVTSS